MKERYRTVASWLAKGLALAEIIAAGIPLRRRITKYRAQCVLMIQMAVVIAPKIPAQIRIALYPALSMRKLHEKEPRMAPMICADEMSDSTVLSNSEVTSTFYCLAMTMLLLLVDEAP